MSDSLNVNQLVSQFLDLSLPADKFTHHAHIKTAIWHLTRYSPEDALNRLRQAIRAFNQAKGGKNTDSDGYHETTTRFYVLLIASQLNTMKPSDDIDGLAEKIIQQIGDPKLMFAYYSRDQLMSKDARRAWMRPDIKSIDFA